MKRELMGGRLAFKRYAIKHLGEIRWCLLDVYIWKKAEGDMGIWVASRNKDIALIGKGSYT